MNRRHFLATTFVSSLALAAGAAEPERKLRVGVIGNTKLGGYGHGLDAMWLHLPETEIVAVADPDAPGLAAELKKLKCDKGFADYRQMLAEIKPDLVAIGPREISGHRDMAVAAAEAGAKGIYMEKPFCPTLAEADEIIAACDRHGTKLALAHRNRYHLVIPAVQKLLKEEGIGRLLEIRTRGKEDARGGVQDLWVLGSHVLNIAIQFGGKPVAVSAAILQDGRPVTKADLKEGTEGVGPVAGNEVHARFELESGIPLFFDSVAKAGAPKAGFGVQLIGTNGIVDMRMDTVPFAQLLPGNPFQPVKDARTWTPISSAGVGQPETNPDANEVMNHAIPARDLIAAIRENREPLCSARAGRETVEMITAIFESQRHGGQRVTFPLQIKSNPLSVL